MTLSEDVEFANGLMGGVVGQELYGFRIDFGLQIDFGGRYVLTIETPFSMAEGAEAFIGEPVSGEAAEVLIPLRLRPVGSVQVLPDGTLTVGIGEAILKVPPHPQFESWQVAGPDGLLVVCPPGASYIASWTPDEKQSAGVPLPSNIWVEVAVAFNIGQKTAVANAFSLAGYDGPLRVASDLKSDERIFVVAPEVREGLRDLRRLAQVVAQLLLRKVAITDTTVYSRDTEPFE